MNVDLCSLKQDTETPFLRLPPELQKMVGHHLLGDRLGHIKLALIHGRDEER